MTATTWNREQRRSKRVKLETTVRYQLGRELGGHAGLVDVDHNGLCVRVSHELAVGQRLMLEVDEPKRGEGSVELKGRVAWCRRDENGFRAGIHVYLDTADVRIVLCALMCAALKKQAAVADLRNRHFIYVEWKLAALDANPEPGTSAIWNSKRASARKPSRTLALGY